MPVLLPRLRPTWQRMCIAQLERLASHSWMRKELILRGFVYDVTTGHL